MEKKKTSKFFFGSVVVFLILLGLVKVILHSMQHLEANEIKPASMKPADVAQRIKPVGEVTVGKAPTVQAAATTDTKASTDVPAASLDRGKQVVTQVCSLCHQAGMMGAPKIGSKDDWAPRIEKGMDTLYSHALKGFNMMPAKGGHPELSDADVKAAVNYMVSLAK